MEGTSAILHRALFEEFDTSTPKLLACPSDSRLCLEMLKSQPATQRPPKPPPRDPGSPLCNTSPEPRWEGAGRGLGRERSASLRPSLPGSHPTACLEHTRSRPQPGQAGAGGCLRTGRGPAVWPHSAGRTAGSSRGASRKEADTHPQPGARAGPAAPRRRGTGLAPARTRRAAAPAGGGSGRRSWGGWRGPAPPAEPEPEGRRAAPVPLGAGGTPAAAAGRPADPARPGRPPPPASAGLQRRGGRGASWEMESGRGARWEMESCRGGGCHSPAPRGGEGTALRRSLGGTGLTPQAPRRVAARDELCRDQGTRGCLPALPAERPRRAGGERGVMAAPEMEGAGRGRCLGGRRLSALGRRGPRRVWPRRPPPAADRYRGLNRRLCPGPPGEAQIAAAPSCTHVAVSVESEELAPSLNKTNALQSSGGVYLR